MTCKEPWNPVQSGLLVLCLMMCNACATTSSDILNPEPPAYMLAPCRFPEPRPVNTNEDLLKLLADFRADLDDCSARHDLLVRFLGE